MTRVATASANVNGVAANATETAEISAVTKWIHDQKSKGDMGDSSAIQYATALSQMGGMVGPGEPGDALSVLNNIDRLCERWARKNPDKKSGTARTYASRAKGILEQYFKWAAAPEKYDPRPSRGRSGETPKRSSEKKSPKEVPIELPVVERPVAAGNAPTNVAANAPPSADARICGLGAGREPFRYTVPADGLKVKDAIRIAFHLITTCDDYDPTVSPMQVVSNALQRVE